jgi:hypothetical protein
MDWRSAMTAAPDPIAEIDITMQFHRSLPHGLSRKQSEEFYVRLPWQIGKVRSCNRNPRLQGQWFIGSKFFRMGQII